MERMTPALSRAAAACLVVGALVGLVSVLVEPTVSEKAKDQAKAISAHAGAMHAGLALNALAAVLLLGGLIWLATVASKSTAALSITGGVLVLLGLMTVMLDDGIQLAGSAVAQGLSQDDAKMAIGPLYSGGISAVGVISVLNGIGMVLIGVALLKTAVPRWIGPAIIVGAVVESIGFGSGQHYIAAVGFAILFVSFAAVARGVLAGASGAATSAANGAELAASSGSASA